MPKDLEKEMAKETMEISAKRLKRVKLKAELKKKYSTTYESRKLLRKSAKSKGRSQYDLESTKEGDKLLSRRGEKSLSNIKRKAAGKVIGDKPKLETRGGQDLARDRAYSRLENRETDIYWRKKIQARKSRWKNEAKALKKKRISERLKVSSGYLKDTLNKFMKSSSSSSGGGGGAGMLKEMSKKKKGY